MGNDSKISLYLRIMDILDYYDENITIERKLQIKKEYGIGDDKNAKISKEYVHNSKRWKKT